jgi:RNA polymerase sigma factor (TIGR02999 family)
LRLVGNDGDRQHWNGRGHFFAAAAEAMRRILVEAARRKGRLKRGGDLGRIDLERDDLATHAPPEALLVIDDAITVLTADDADAAQLVKLRYFAGLSIEQAAELMGMSRSTAYERWAYARAWLLCQFQGRPDRPAP